MSERYPRPATADNVGWNTTPTNPSTDPGAAVRAAGWATNAIPGSDEFNYVQTMLGDFAQWLEGFAAREWNQIAQGIAASSYMDLFRVTPPLGSSIMSPRLSQWFSLTGTAATGGNVIHICGDGEQIYYVSGSVGQSVIAANPNGITEIWETSPFTQHTAICADGLNVYAMSPFSPSELGLRKINRTTGATLATAGAEYACSDLRANGVYCVGISPASNAGGLVFYTVATPVETGVNAVSTQLNGVAIDEDQCYVGGARAGGNDVWCCKLSDRSYPWQVPLDTNAPTVNAICADGDYVYVCTDNFVTALPGTPNRDLFCLERTSGAIIWSMDIGADLDACAVDSDYLYVVTSAGLAYAIRLRGSVGVGGIVASQTSVAAAGGIFVDGMNLFCQDGAAATKMRSLATTSATRGFMRVNGADPARRPFHNLAIPINNG